MLSNMTFEELITTQNGLHVSRALVNVIINRQIGQQISASFLYFRSKCRCSPSTCRLTQLVRSCNKDADPSAARTTLCFTRYTMSTTKYVMSLMEFSPGARKCPQSIRYKGSQRETECIRRVVTVWQFDGDLSFST